VRILLRHPGYSWLDATLAFERAVRSVPRFELEVRSEMRRRDLVLAFDATNSLTDPVARGEMVGQLALTRTSGQPWHCVVHGRDLPRMLLRGVPDDVQSVTFLPAGWPHLPAENLPTVSVGSRIEGGDRAVDPLPLSAYGSVRYTSAGGAQGWSDAPLLVLRLSQRGATGEFTSRAAEGVTVAVHAVPPGEYDVQVEHVETAAVEHYTAVVRAGEVTHVRRQ
jgi:hypothetical protein